ncbi:MAG TPA: citrate/2-methylcitrate synthase [Thermoplasmataceae archaeon]|nr:citrate/2-methylcitrate synthase [Thermoplasmatales archaeon AK]HLH85580.1 citrate/2-methylcitrate synthase [Thermoplasmataceae archaeon]
MSDGEIEVPKGLAGVIVDKTSIATTDSEGNLVYRGYRVVDLVRKHSFEDVAYLIVNGKLPSKKERDGFFSTIRGFYGLDSRVVQVMEILREKDLMRNLRSIVSLYPYRSRNNDELMLEMAAKFPEIISASYRISKGMDLLHDIEGSYAQRLYYLITGKNDSRNASFLETLMILYMEHEFNASTFALRVTASTLADPIAAFTTALGTLKGPLHGGANSEILDFFEQFRDEEDAVEYVDSTLAKGEKVMGFGHRVYKRLDPRAQLVKAKLKELSPGSKMVRIAEAVEKRMWEKKSIPANVDFYAAIYMDLLGIPNDFYTPIFAASRVFGWIAHYKEQINDNKLIRPASKYVGPRDLVP